MNLYGYVLDREEIEQVVRVLDRINPGRVSVNYLLDMIGAHICSKEADNTYVSTCGWTAFVWKDRGGQKHVKVAIAAYAVESYLRLGKPED